jgi:DNA-binding NtrC family response regulator
MSGIAPAAVRPLSAAAPSALVVDDDPDMCWVLKLTLELSGHSVTVARNAHEALSLAAERAFPLAFIDARLPDMDGLQLADKMASHHRIVRIIIISGYYSEDDVSIVEAIRAMRVDGFLAKPFAIEAIEQALRAPLRARRCRR